jgi:hypothetical protein
MHLIASEKVHQSLQIEEDPGNYSGVGIYIHGPREEIIGFVVPLRARSDDDERCLNTLRVATDIGSSARQKNCRTSVRTSTARLAKV